MYNIHLCVFFLFQEGQDKQFLVARVNEALDKEMQ